MITLNNQELSQDLLWQDRFSASTAAQSNRPTIGGKAVVQHSPRQVAGRSITLVATIAGNQYSGFFTQAQIKEIEEYQRTGAQIPLHYHGQDFTVMVQAGGVSVTPIIDYADSQDEDLYSGAVTFIQL